MKYAYIIFEEITGTQICICSSMEDAIMYTRKLQKQSDMRVSERKEHYAWTQLPLIEHKDVPYFTGNIGFKRTGSYNPQLGWYIDSLGLVNYNSENLIINYTDNIPDVQFEITSLGGINFTVISSAYLSDIEVLEFVKDKYMEWLK